MRITIAFTLLFSSYCVNGQTLSLNDISHIRTLDSLELINFGQEKGFELKEVQMDTWRSMHKYHSVTDNLIWFERNFPTGKQLFPGDGTSEDYRTVFYHFQDETTLTEFKKEMKVKGFKYKRTYSNDYRGNKFTHNIYQTKENEIDLGSEELLGQKTKYFIVYRTRD